MARLSQYPKDTSPDKLDSFLTLDSTSGNTTRLDIQDIAGVIADSDLIDTADSALFQYQTPNDLNYTVKQDGLIVLNPVGTNATRLFSTITQLYVSKSGFNGKNISTYLSDLNGYQIKVSKLGDLNVFGIFEVTQAVDYTDHYIRLAVIYRDRGSGSLEYGAKYYISHHQTSFDNDFSDNSVTEFGDVSDAGSGYIITDGERARVNEVTSKIFYSDIVDDLTSNIANKPLSANQGLVLKQFIDNINTLLTSDNVDLNSLQEVVDFIEANKTILDTLTISNIAGLQTALDSKVDKVAGKQLSENDFTSALLAKLNGIALGAEVNVQSNYTETDPANDSFILNKPSDVTDLSIHSVTELNDISSTGSGAIITDGERGSINGLVNTTSSSTTVQTNDLLKIGTIAEFVSSQPVEPSNNNAIYYTTEDGHDVLQFKNHGHRISMDSIVSNLSSGLLSGGGISSSSATEFTVAAGHGVILDMNKEQASVDPHPELKNIAWSAYTATVSGLDVNDTNDKQTWIYVDETGTVQQQNTPFTDAQYNNTIPLGAVIHRAGNVRFGKSFPRTAYGQQNQFAEFARIFGPLKKSGHELSGVAGTLQIARSQGVSFAFGRNYATDPNNPSFVTDSGQTPALIHRYYQDGSGGFIKDTNSGSGYTTLDIDKYDDGSGTLATLSNNKFSTQRVYYFPNNPTSIIVYYGRQEFDTLDAANTSIQAEPFTEAKNTANQAIFLGYVIAEKGATDLTSTTNVRILNAGIFRSVAFSSTGAAASAANLADLADTTIQSPANGQLLEYSSTTQTWNNITPNFNQNAMAMAVALGG
tara:strand:- start:11621 stop:14065 length:2445 start_codon:yes stop_codon:yes gene_type:complete